MAFFNCKLTVIESYESALKSKQAARQKLAEQKAKESEHLTVRSRPYPRLTIFL
jgi:hypothetical protein